LLIKWHDLSYNQLSEYYNVNSHFITGCTDCGKDIKNNAIVFGKKMRIVKG